MTGRPAARAVLAAAGLLAVWGLGGGGCHSTAPAARGGPFFGAPLEPPAGRVLHGWGQISGQWTWDDPASAGDEADLAAYEAAVAPHHPAMISFYVAPVENQVTGFLRKYPVVVRGRPFFVAQIGLYFLDRPLQEAVASGAADGELRRLFAGLKSVGRPVLLRIGHEFNGEDAEYDPALYVPAFRRVAALAREVAPGLVATVWAAESAGLANRDAMDWYPGDAWVDWWGQSLFFQEHVTAPATVAFVRAAVEHRKPFLIGECSPWFRGDRANPVRGARSVDEAWGWYESLFAFIEAHTHVKAVSLIVVDWTRWRPIFPSVPGGFPDTRLSVWPGLRDRVRTRLADPRWLHAAEAAKVSARGGS